VHLLLLRHAKSGWTDPQTRDHDRPLTPRGERAAAQVGAYLAGRAPSPDLVLCSSARRAQETLGRVLAALPVSPEVRIEPEIYGAGPAGLLRVITSVSPSVRSLLVIGHNPTMGDLALDLAGVGPPEALLRLTRKFPTAALVELRFACGGWDEITPGAGELVAYSTPKLLDRAAEGP
jgi:phosphohistidine phosphatase